MTDTICASKETDPQDLSVEGDILPPMDSSWDSDGDGVQIKEVEAMQHAMGDEGVAGTVEVNEKEKFLQHLEMLAVLMSFLDGRCKNAPGREVLL